MINRKAFLIKTIEEGFKNKVSGYPLTLKKSKGKKLIDYRVYGNSVQNGTPTPDNPVEIESVGDKTDNLIDYKQFTPYGTSEITFIDNGIQYTGSYYIKATINNLVSGNVYVMSFDIESTDEIKSFWRYQYTDKTYSTPASSGTSITIPEDKTVESILLYPEISATIHTTKITNIQLLQGNTIKTYEPYGYKIPITVSGKNLIDINSFSTIDSYIGQSFYKKIDGDVTFTAKLKENKAIPTNAYLGVISKTKEGKWISNPRWLIRDGVQIAEKVTFNANIFNTDDYKDLIVAIYPSSVVNEVLDSFEIQMEKSTSSTNYEPYQEPITANIYLDEPLRKIGDYADYIDFKNKKVVRNVKEVDTVLSILSTQKTETLDLPNVLTYRGTNIITTDTTIQPSKIEATYCSFEKEV